MHIHRAGKLIRCAGLVSLAFYLSACACLPSAKNAIDRKYYNSWEMDIGYAQVVKVGSRIYISGVVSDASTFDAQLQEDYAVIQKILKDYGVDGKAVVKETIFTRDLEVLKKAISVRKQFYVDGNYPSATWVQVQRLYMENNLVEVEVEAELSR